MKNNKKVILISFFFILIVCVFFAIKRNGADAPKPVAENQTLKPVSKPQPEEVIPAERLKPENNAANDIAAGKTSENESIEKKSVPPAPGAPEKPAHALVRELKGTGIISGNAVNVRSGSKIDVKNSNVVCKLNKGDRVEIIGSEKPSNDNHIWYKIRTKDGKTGFVRDDLIEQK